MSLTEEQRRRLDGLSEARRKRVREREIARIKEQMSDEMIDGFADKYAFADDETAERLKTLLNSLPANGVGIDFNRLPAHRSFSVSEDTARTVWFCSLCGSEGVFEVFVKGRIADFLSDYDGWYFFGAYMLLVYEDLSGFVYIDDNKEMTEASLRSV